MDRAHESLLSILDGLDAIVYVADVKTHEIVYANRRTLSLFGDVIGRKCWASLQEAQEGPCDFCTNSRLLNEDGSVGSPYVWEFQNTI